MKSSRGLLPIVMLVLWLAPAPAAADWQITPFVGVIFGGETNIIDPEKAAGEAKLTFGGSVVLIGDGVFGIEGEFGFIPGFFQRESENPLVTQSNVTTGMGNLVLALPARWTGLSPRPFFSGGLGFIRASLTDVFNVFPLNDSMLGLNLGGGIVGFFDDRRGVRLEIRYFKNITGGDDETTSFGHARIKFWRASAGFVLKY